MRLGSFAFQSVTMGSMGGCGRICALFFSSVPIVRKVSQFRGTVSGNPCPLKWVFFWDGVMVRQSWPPRIRPAGIIRISSQCPRRGSSSASTKVGEKTPLSRAVAGCLGSASAPMTTVFFSSFLFITHLFRVGKITLPFHDLHIKANWIMFVLFKYSPLVDASGSSAVLSLDSNQKKCELNLCTIPTQWPPSIRYAYILPLSVIRNSHVIFPWNFCNICWCHNRNKAVKMKGPTLFVTSAFHICPYILISWETNGPNKSPGNGWNWSREPQSTWIKWKTDANGYPGGATFLLSCHTYQE